MSNDREKVELADAVIKTLSTCLTDLSTTVALTYQDKFTDAAVKIAQVAVKIEAIGDGIVTLATTYDQVNFLQYMNKVTNNLDSQE